VESKLIKLAINGFGRIGRLVARVVLEQPDMELVAINDLSPGASAAHLFKYDSVHGVYPGDVGASDGQLVLGGRTTPYFSEREPQNLPWKELGVDIVIEATGKFTAREKAALHLQAGAKKTLITAPGKKVDQTIVMGVNEAVYDKDKHHVVSNASCTSNCLAPVAKVLLDAFGVKHGLMTTIHAYTNDQRVLDFDHKDLRRARAAALSMIPTTTGAAAAVGEVIPALKGRLDGMAIRVPTPNVSVVDLTAELEKPATVEAVNAAFKAAAESSLRGILKYTEEPLVSRDYNGESHSSVVDGLLTMATGGTMIKVVAWYDNEWGYSLRVVDLARYMLG
jgi:glyceraldehyde 3-phosphate dehydrogenase